MLAEFLQGLLLGATGLIPFFHTNLAIELFKPSGFFFVTVASLSFSHLVFESIPSIFLFTPTDSQPISAIPAQSLARQGKALYSLKLVLAALFASALFSILLLPFFSILLPPIFNAVRPFTGIALIAVIAAVFFQEWKSNSLLKFAALFSLSGLLGKIVFDTPLSNPLFPLLTGLFAVPVLLESIFSSHNQKPAAKDQDDSFPKISFPLIFAGVLLGALSGLLPALSPSMIASVAYLFFSSQPATFLTLSTSIICSKLFYDFFYSIFLHKARSAPAALLAGANLTSRDFLLLEVTAVAAIAASALLLLLSARKLLLFFNRIGEKVFSASILALILFWLYYSQGAPGLFALTACALVGLLPGQYGVKKSACTGALILPTIAYFIPAIPYFM
ncbi:tripartite tricarboxylate transporter permease [Candidatus Micrarchaeota archaeon]|nr:tripartite tricarboxylate transporter permease [Candidatus Micrarchaeota archaeon]